MALNNDELLEVQLKVTDLRQLWRYVAREERKGNNESAKRATAAARRIERELNTKFGEMWKAATGPPGPNEQTKT